MRFLTMRAIFVGEGHSAPESTATESIKDHLSQPTWTPIRGGKIEETEFQL